MNDPNDIVRDIEAWLSGVEPKIRQAETVLMRRAIEEIRSLREKMGERRAKESLESGELNASNDE